eukprot:1234284-Amphidinium_carterae.1
MDRKHDQEYRRISVVLRPCCHTAAACLLLKGFPPQQSLNCWAHTGADASFMHPEFSPCE